MDNYGLLEKEITPRDWIVNEYTPLGGIQRTVNWSAYLPIVEYQNNNGWDRYACVSYAILNWLEVEMRYQTGVEHNFSDRFLASASGTRMYFGNYVADVFDTLRNKGIVYESLYPDVMTPKEYYKPIPQEILNEAKEPLKNYELYREWINPNDKNAIQEALYQTTLVITAKGVLSSQEDTIFNPEGKANHCMLLYGINEDGHYLLYDHYTQSHKIYHKDYIFGSVLKPTLILKNKIMFVPENNKLYLLVEGKEQKLGMGFDGKLVVYDDKVDTLLNSWSRLQKVDKPNPTSLAQWDSVDKINGKLELIEKSI